MPTYVVFYKHAVSIDSGGFSWFSGNLAWLSNMGQHDLFSSVIYLLNCGDFPVRYLTNYQSATVNLVKSSLYPSNSFLWTWWDAGHFPTPRHGHFPTPRNGHFPTPKNGHFSTQLCKIRRGIFTAAKILRNALTKRRDPGSFGTFTHISVHARISIYDLLFLKWIYGIMLRFHVGFLESV